MKFGILTWVKTQISEITNVRYNNSMVPLWVHLLRLTRNLVYYLRSRYLEIVRLLSRFENFFRYSDTISRSFWDFIYWILDLTSWILHRGSWILNLGSCILDQDRRPWIVDLGSLILDHGPWILDFGLWTVFLKKILKRFNSWQIPI